MPKVTRSQSKHFIIGHPAPLPKTQLPTKGEVLNHVKWLQSSSKSSRQGVSAVFRTVAEEVVSVWESEGIPVHDVKYVTRRIKLECHDELRRASKAPVNRRDGHPDCFQQLFDIARCRCHVRNSCNCPAESKIPPDEWDFVQDQRGNRRLSLGAHDRATSTARAARQERQEARHRPERGE